MSPSPILKFSRGPPGAAADTHTHAAHTPHRSVLRFFSLSLAATVGDYFIRIEWYYRESISGKLAVPASLAATAASVAAAAAACSSPNQLVETRRITGKLSSPFASRKLVLAVVVGLLVRARLRRIFHFAFVRDPSRAAVVSLALGNLFGARVASRDFHTATGETREKENRPVIRSRARTVAV